jgi:hypothetical protein
MTTPINLTQLRAAIEEAARLGDGGVEMEATFVLALIDTAEAAQDYLRTSWSHNETPAVRRLRETLNHYTTNDIHTP